MLRCKRTSARFTSYDLEIVEMFKRTAGEHVWYSAVWVKCYVVIAALTWVIGRCCHCESTSQLTQLLSSVIQSRLQVADLPLPVAHTPVWQWTALSRVHTFTKANSQPINQLDSLHWFSQRHSRTPHFWGCTPRGLRLPNSNWADTFVQCTYASFIIPCLLVLKLSCWQMNTQTNKQTPLKTSNALRYSTMLWFVELASYVTSSESEVPMDHCPWLMVCKHGKKDMS